MARPQKRRGRWRRRAGRVLWWSGLAFLAAGLLAGVVTYRDLTATLPPVEQLAHYRPPMATRVYSDDGAVIGEFFFERRYVVPLHRIPPLVRHAFIAAEDAQFYSHRGVNLLSIARALANNLRAGAVVQGGSTITQQVVKSLLLSPERSYERKLREMILALRLERQFSKDDILFLYLNHIYLGSGAYGVAAAARAYFDKNVEDLTLAEAALLAGLPQAPSRYSPLRHWERARARQRYVLDRMVAEGLITPSERQAALREPVTVIPQRHRPPALAGYYLEHVRRLLEARYGETAPYQLGLRVHTALNLQMQAAAERALREGLRAISRRRGWRGPIRHVPREKIEATARELAPEQPLRVGEVYRAVVTESRAGGAWARLGDNLGWLPRRTLAWTGRRDPRRLLQPGDVIAVRLEEPQDDDPRIRLALDQEPEVEGALVALDPLTGYVKAMVGGYDFARSQFNRATQARRQPGSAFKALIYAAALDRGYTPATITLDEPLILKSGPGRYWEPHNYDRRYYGPTTLRDALTYSRNVVTVKIVQDIGLPYLLDRLRQFGIDRPLAPNPSIALGTAELSPLELARAYGAFATQGFLFEPVFVTRITDPEGTELQRFEPRFKRVLSAETAYLVTSMLQDVVRRGTGRQAGALGRPCAGKTGTTDDHHDAWFVGFTPDLVAAVWVGFDQERSLGRGQTGGRVAAPIWRRFMESALEGRPIRDFPIPDGIVFTYIDPATGLRARPGGPARLECFRRGTEPLVVTAMDPDSGSPYGRGTGTHEHHEWREFPRKSPRERWVPRIEHEGTDW